MSAVFALWERSPRGLTFSLLQNRGEPPALTEREARKKIGRPLLLKDGDETLPLDVLMRLYPAPLGAGPKAERVAKIKALAEDDRGDANTRAVAAAKLQSIAAERSNDIGA